ncbi:MAG TPA: penicillin-binding protein, partial [Blastocatellia bacterium]|nr:penicillin-binding protein [Blastocatellia bacterium]
VAVKRRLSNEEAAAVEALKAPGLEFVDEMKRFYVSGQTAAHVLGFVNIKEEGQAGVELFLNKAIQGKGGRVRIARDALNNSFDSTVIPPEPGANVTLTIDALIQHHAEKALAEAVRAAGARGGTAVVMRPATGEILALASCPTFDPNKISGSDKEKLRNRAVESVFEPGSIFKLITYSAALEENLIRPDSRIDCANGQIAVPGRIIRDGHVGVMTATKALAQSSNVAAIKLGMSLGYERLARYIRLFGFGSRAGVELPAESAGLLRDVSRWQPGTIGSIPIGYEIGVTAVQTVAAFACIANGGEYVQPHLIRRVESPTGVLLEESRPERRRVVSPATAAMLTQMLAGVVEQGTGKRAQIKGFRVAGKTGTARKIDPVTRRYTTRYISSFAGFAPAERPEIACLISIDDPRGAYYGGDVAAPVFARVVAEALQVLGVQPENAIQPYIAQDDLRVDDAPPTIIENEAAQVDEAGGGAPALDIAAETEQPEDASKGGVVVPDLIGKGVRAALALCLERGLQLQVSGDGVIVSQSLRPGTRVQPGAVCQVKLSRQVARSKGTGEQKSREAIYSGLR